MEVKTIKEASYHRNGICGAGFHVIRFTADIDGGCKDANFLGILFDASGECAVICTDMLESHGVAFAQGNSWRGDHFEPALRAAIDESNAQMDRRLGIK